MTLRMDQLGDLGYAQLVAAITGPLAAGGADAFRTYSERKLGEEELEQRQREQEALADLYRRQQISAERRQAIEAVLRAREQQLRASTGLRNAPYFVAGLALFGLALVGIAAARRKR